MMFLTHLLFGILAGIIGCDFLNCNNLVLFISTAAVFSSLPDIDHLGSKISRILPPFAIVAKLFFKHRGFTHSIFPALLLYIIVASVSKELAAAVMIGYLSHILLDATTKKGIAPFTPFSKLKINGILKTNSFAERIMMFAILSAIVLQLF